MHLFLCPNLSCDGHDMICYMMLMTNVHECCYVLMVL
jgi:hypothetical protein